MWADFFERLDFPELVHLVKRIKCFFHAFDRDSFLGRDVDGLNHLGEAAFALFAQEAVFWGVRTAKLLFYAPSNFIINLSMNEIVYRLREGTGLDIGQRKRKIAV